MQLRLRNQYRELVINILLFAVNAIATKLVTFVLVPLYTYYMSAGEYGLTDMSLTVINLLTPLVTLDVAEAAVRFIVGDRLRGDQYAAVTFGVTLGSVAIVALISPCLDFPAFGGLGDYKSWFVATYAASAFMNMCGEIARGIGKVRIIPVCAAISSAITLVLAILLIAHAGMGVRGYFISVIVGPTIATIIYLLFGDIGRAAVKGAVKMRGIPRNEVISLCVPMLRYALPLIPNSLFWWISTGINRLFITSMLGIAASGMFAAASKVPNLLNVAYSIFQQAWQLSAFRETEKSKEDTARFFSRIYTVVQAGMSTLCSLLALLAPQIASILLQGETWEAWPMIAPLLLANYFNMLSAFYGTVYTSTMHTSFIMKTTGLGALSCAVLTPLLIPVAGIYGACVASVFGQGAVFLVRAIDSRKYLDFDAGWTCLIPTIALLIVQMFATMLKPSHWQLLSFACFICIASIQGVKAIPMIAPIFKSAKKKGGY